MNQGSLYQWDCRVWVSPMPEEHVLPECIVPMVKFSGGETTGKPTALVCPELRLQGVQQPSKVSDFEF
ncbi:hypothetical protein TNCV_1194221 [Trichonephila clavipes]|nr:hypothetical protein TNCV_1194221 [Trichonephila clavipes]